MLRRVTSIPPIQDALPTGFYAPELQQIRSRLARMELRRLHEPAPQAAVLVPLCHVGGAPSVLFTKRTQTVGTHKGEVSFPGGRRDADDVDEIATALRELEEETGICRHDVDVLGRFHEVTSITGLRVTPVIAFVGDIDPSSLRISPAEIDVAFALSLAALVDPSQRAIQQLGLRSVPVFSAGPFPVWGLTAFILEEVLREALGVELPPLP